MQSQSLKKQFEADGYVAVPGFISGSDLAELQTNLDRLIRQVVPTMPPQNVFYEDKSRPETLKQLSDLHLHDPYFGEMLRHSRFQRLAEVLLEDQVIAKNLQYFNKPPARNQPTPPHQDGYYFKLKPCEAVTMWLALDVVDEENGCVRYVRGSHRSGMRLHGRTEVLGFSQGIVDFGEGDDLANEVSMPAQPGDLLVHHALTIHRAGGNRSANRSRRSLGFLYYAQRSRENTADLQAYNERLNIELAVAGKI